MAFVERAIPVGGASLNFEVVGGTTEPTNPKENTIWVNTETAIGEWQFSAVEPTTRVDGSALVAGDVWCKTSDFGTRGFNALKKNGIIIYIASAYQWNGTAWISQETQAYIDGGWEQAGAFLCAKGVVTQGFSLEASTKGASISNTGTQTPTITYGDGYVQIGYSEAYNRGGVWVMPAIDLTNYSNLCVKLTDVVPTKGDVYLHIASSYVDKFSSVAKSARLRDFPNSVVKVDISSVTGVNYVCFAVNGNGGSSGTQYLQFADLWLE